MEKPIRVEILGREYSLRVRPEDEELTLDIASYVDEKMQAFKEAHPGQSELTTAIITALAIAEELYSSWEAQDAAEDAFDETLEALADRLGEALEGSSESAESDPNEAAAPAALEADSES